MSSAAAASCTTSQAARWAAGQWRRKSSSTASAEPRCAARTSAARAPQRGRRNDRPSEAGRGSRCVAMTNTVPLATCAGPGEVHATEGNPVQSAGKNSSGSGSVGAGPNTGGRQPLLGSVRWTRSPCAGLTKTYGDLHAVRGIDVAVRGRRDVRDPRAERRGQDDDPRDDRGPHPARRGQRSRSSASRSGRTPSACSGGSACSCSRRPSSTT